MATVNMLDFLQMNRPDGPCLVVDLAVIRDNYRHFTHGLPDSKIYYAVKANPAPEILTLLAAQGSCFDTASITEIDMVLAVGVTPDRISFGNTIKKERDIAAAYQRGIRLFAVDCHEEVEKITRAAPGSSVFCRILCDGEGAEWPLSRKFGCDTVMAIDVLRAADANGLVACGVSFHVGSQQTNLDAWDKALAECSKIFKTLAADGIFLTLVNMGGGFPTRYLKDIPAASDYGQSIRQSLKRHFGNQLPETIIEPGRGMVGNAGVIKAEIVLISRKSANDDTRWVYLDIGKFGGLAETMDEAIRYPITTPHDGDRTSPCIIAGPTCDSADVLYEKKTYPLPISLAIGDIVLIEATGAYTTTYASNGFNGFAPLPAFIVDAA
jgi:ornithine decarboxylase